MRYGFLCLVTVSAVALCVREGVGETDGTQKWSFTTGGGVISSPAIGADGTIYVGSVDGQLYVLNPDGTQKWSAESRKVVPVRSLIKSYRVS